MRIRVVGAPAVVVETVVVVAGAAVDGAGVVIGDVKYNLL